MADIESVRHLERRQISLAELRFECDGQRMKPQKIKQAGFENTPVSWWVEFQPWPEQAFLDPSVVHVPTACLTFKQACDFRQLLKTVDGIDVLMEWLIENDQIVRSAFVTAREEAVVPEYVEKAVIVILANAFRNITVSTNNSFVVSSQG